MDTKTEMRSAPRAATAADEALLSDVEIEAAKKVAREEVKAEHKARAKKALVAKYKLEAEAELDPAEATRPITLDLASHQPSIMLDGVIYWHGNTYQVKKSVYEALVEVQSRGWDHEESLRKNENNGRRPRRPTLSNDNVGASAAQLLRA